MYCTLYVQLKHQCFK